MHVWINGSWSHRNEATISIFDAGFQHGVGLFETLHARNGKAFRSIQHIERLRESAHLLGLTEQLRPGPLADAIQHVLDRNEMREARIRLTVTGGDLNWLQSHGKTQHEPTVAITAQPLTSYPDEMFENGIMVRVADARVNPLDPFAGHKTLHYWPRIRELQHASRMGAGESLWFSVTNHLAGGSVSNVFLVWNDQLLTPFARGEEEEGALTAPVLPGITRRAIIELAESMDVPVVHRMLSVEDVEAADEMFLTNSSWGVLPVVALERIRIGEGRPGDLTRRLRTALAHLIEQETAGE